MKLLSILHAFLFLTFFILVNSFTILDQTEKSSWFTNSGDTLRKRHTRAAAVSDKISIFWPNNEIPYRLVDDYSAEEKCHVERAMYHVMWNSCVRFRTNTQNETKFFNYIKRGPYCFNMGTILHQIMHSIGFLDETRRHDRDEFVQILWGNISKNFVFIYDKIKKNKEIVLTPYDFDSIMHDKNDGFAILGTETLAPKQPNIKLESTSDKVRLSKLDVEGLNKLYGCANPLKQSYEFIRQFVEHYHRCVGKIYNDINRYNALVKNQFALKSSKKRSIESNEINGIIVQGDILIRVNKPQTFPDPDDKIQASAINPAINALFYNRTTWTNGIIPYDLDSSLENHKCLIENAMLQIMLNTCIRFRPRNGRDTFYVRILQDPTPSCYSSIGMELQNYVTKISLSNGCLHIGTVVHELMHTIGFYHHQNRQDRNQYLKVHFENIEPKKRKNFRLNDPSVEQIFTKWDYDSVMLYGPKYFSEDGQSITMEPTVPGVELKNVYHKTGLSKFDALAINQLYKCPNVSNSNFYSDLSLMKPMLKLVKSCNSTSPANVESYQYIFK